jgi:hypothetical protein
VLTDFEYFQRVFAQPINTPYNTLLLSFDCFCLFLPTPHLVQCLELVNVTLKRPDPSGCQQNYGRLKEGPHLVSTFGEGGKYLEE